MEEQFGYLLRVSGGWAQARLTLSDDTALIEYDSASMGQIPVRFLMRCEHRKFSEFHGELIMTSIEQSLAQRNQFGGHFFTEVKETVNTGRLIDPDAEEEMLEVLNTFDIEYIGLPEPQQRLDEPGGNWGVHDWLDTFSLILMIHDAGYWHTLSDRFAQTPLGRALDHLDKMHFAVAQGKYSIQS